MKIVYFGTPEFAADALSYLFEHKVPVCAVVTQPDRPKGRSLKAASSPVKIVASEKDPHLPIFQPEKASEERFLEELANLKADLFVVVAFGQILPQKLLDIPPLGCINVHASLLPKYRGAAPIQRCLIAGERETGVCIQKMVKQLDAGDVIATAKAEISEDMTYGELEEILCELSKPLLLFVLQAYEKGIPPAEPQNTSLISYASKIESEEGKIDWGLPAAKIHNLIRGLSPRPGAWTYILNGEEKKRVKILRTQVLAQSGKPGHLIAPTGIVGCGQGAIQLLEVQPEGKKAMPAPDWLRGFRSLPEFF
jgi:methionyl-tRNA formyltransferase